VKNVLDEKRNNLMKTLRIKL